MKSFEQRFGAPPESSPLSGENTKRQRLEAVYNSAILDTKPEKIVATIKKALEANGMTVEDLEEAPELQRLWDENIDKLPN